jgi:hypothetical protein
MKETKKMLYGILRLAWMMPKLNQGRNRLMFLVVFTRSVGAGEYGGVQGPLNVY